MSIWGIRFFDCDQEVCFPYDPLPPTVANDSWFVENVAAVTAITGYAALAAGTLAAAAGAAVPPLPVCMVELRRCPADEYSSMRRLWS